MRNDKLIPGMILVMIGAIFLLNNFGYINFHWSNVFHLWPIFLVIAGVNLVFANNRSPWASILKISVVVAGFALLIFGNFTYRYNWWWPHSSHYYHRDDNDNSSNDNSDDDDDNDNGGKLTKVEGNSVFNEPYKATMRVARLNISGGATSYSLNDTTNQLFNANTKEVFGGYTFNPHQEDSVYVVDFKMKDHKEGFNFDSNNANKVDIKLNQNPEWEVNVDAGATELNFDLSKFKVRNVKLNGGAGSFTLKLGQPLATTNVNVSTGAADVNISIPQNAACRITKSSAFSSNDFDGFIKTNDGNYETSGFSAAKNKIYINLSGGFSGFEVKRY
ncbi:LiaI-LiaF-like domain-containing protein [Mucilaginibacter sp. McL0603]|uniref:LiaI-LiaF-like domain-containing protein n=1 Tax=Mucilaginibacter sp. McL0603 TaxID=3415670 RepID=UPI003CFB90D8